MIERIEDMPEGTIGLRASGKLSVEDYRNVIEPMIRDEFGAGIRLLFVLTDFKGLENGAWIEDVKLGLRAWVREYSAWKRMALVTDVEWVGKAMRAFAWMAPGEVRVFDQGGFEEARAWVAASD